MKRVSSYLKMRVLGAIESAPGSTIVARIHHVSEQAFLDEDGRRFQFTWRTIQTWYSRYKKDGTTTVLQKPRSDKGKTRKMTPEEVLEAIEQVRGSFRGRHNVTAFYRACIEKGFLQRERIAPNTFRRVVKAHELLKPDAKIESKRRLAFAKAHANELWQADTMVGPYVQHGAGRVQSKLIAFLDDASRVCCHGEFFLADNTEALLKAFKTALYKRGLCECLYVDNGSNYASLEMTQVCQRLGAILCHTPVRDGAAKGKIERFFRTVRESFLTRALDLSSLDALNRAFSSWVEDGYHQREHSSLGMKPIDRFGLDLNRIRFLPPSEVSDELFFVEQDRTVLADNTFSLKNTRFEAPRDLRNRKVQIRFDRLKFDRAIVYFKGERMGEARPVDFVANDRRPSKKAATSERAHLPEGEVQS
jgi:transposase InsO family protein